MSELWFDLAGFWVHGTRWEPTVRHDEQDPVLLVHGLGASTLSWDRVGQALSDDLGTTVTAVDLPGFGRTRSPDRRASFDTHRAVVRGALEHLGPAIVAGNSMGGAISTSVAATDPDLVRGLVLVNAAYPRPSRNFDHLTRTAKFAALTAGRVATPLVAARARRLGPERLVDATLAFVIAEPDRLDPELRERLVALAVERRHHPEAARSYAESGGSLFRYLAGGMRDDLAAVTSPTLVLHGRRDRLVPVSFARHVAETRSDWRYVEFADCGHAPQMELPERFVATVSRWAEQELRGRATRA
jgi:pimeloyl-ACP methyl ester carboxylesterase